jgi:hypothetical protein
LTKSPGKAVEMIEALISKRQLASALDKLEKLPSFTKALDSFLSAMRGARAA